MRAIGRAVLAVVCLYAYGAAAQAADRDGAAKAFHQRHWDTAITLLENDAASPQDRRMLALAYFHTQDYDSALPLLEESWRASRNDPKVASALAEIRLDQGEHELAGPLCKDLRRLVDEDTATFCETRIALEGENPGEARKALQRLVHDAEPDLAMRAADLEIESLLLEGDLSGAHALAETARKRHPAPEHAVRFEPFAPENQVRADFSTYLGYRFELDDNVAYPEDPFGSGEEDSRHVLTADLMYERSLSGTWSLYVHANALQSFHADLDQYDLTRLNGTVALGQSGKTFGWRLPVEFNHDRVDGDSYRSSVSTQPGFYIQFGRDFFSHFYARFRSEDYDRFNHPDEDRSGDVRGGGVLLRGQVSGSVSLNAYLEFNRYDTNGRYWQRDERVAFAHAEYEFASNWTAGLALRFQEEHYDHPRPVFADRQQDESTEVYLNLTHRFRRHWRWRGQVSLMDHDSNLPLFDYQRQVVSFAVSREF